MYKRQVNELHPYAFSIVDTFGSMMKEDMLRIYSLIEHNLDKSIVIGVHLHENLALSYSLAQDFINMKSSERECAIDASTVSYTHLVEAVEKEGRFTPRAIIAVDLFGQPADYPEIRRIADEHELKLLEDGAQGFGGEIDGRKACSFGDISTTSFFPAKPLGCYGDGGAVFTDNEEWAALLSSLKVHGKGSGKYDNIRIGMNSRLDTIQAAILLVKLEAFCKYELEAVNEKAASYTEQLKGQVQTPLVKEGFLSSWAQYSILLENQERRDGLKQYLAEKEIPSMVYYPRWV